MKVAAKLLISACLLGVILWVLGGVGEVGTQIQRISFFYAAVIIGLTNFDRALMTYKWGLLLRGSGIKLPFFKGMLIYCGSSLWGFFMPSTIGPDAIRAYSTCKTGIQAREVIASIIIERFIGFLSALVLAVASLIMVTFLGLLGGQVLIIWLLAAGLMTGAAGLFVVSINQSAFALLHEKLLRRFKNNRINEKLREIHETYRSFAINRRNLGVFFGLTLGEQLIPICDSWLIAKGMGIETDVRYFIVAIPLAMLIARLPISINGIGIFEGTLIMILSLAGLSAAESVAIAFMGRILETVALLPWWLAFLLKGNGSAQLAVSKVDGCIAGGKG